MQFFAAYVCMLLVLMAPLAAVKVSSANKTLEGINVTISNTPSEFSGGKKLNITATDRGSLEGLKSLKSLIQQIELGDDYDSNDTKKACVIQLNPNALEILDAVQQALINHEES